MERCFRNPRTGVRIFDFDAPDCRRVYDYRFAGIVYDFVRFLLHRGILGVEKSVEMKKRNPAYRATFDMQDFFARACK